MERLTERFDGWVMRKGCHGPCRTCNRAECADIYPMIDRLAAYEDAMPIERAQELAQAEKDGRLAILPPNDPLTLEQLREMDGNAVWVLCDEQAVHTTPGFKPLMFQSLVEVRDGSVFLTNNRGGRTEYAADEELEADGITLYRRKPEEEQ